MIHAQIEIARQQLKNLGTLTVHTFVKKEIGRGYLGTVVVKTAQGRELMYKTVDLQTVQFVRGGNDMVALPSAMQALDEHFTSRVIADEAMTEMITLCSELNLYPEGTFKSHPYYGQEVSIGDLCELSIDNDGYINLF